MGRVLAEGVGGVAAHPVRLALALGLTLGLLAASSAVAATPPEPRTVVQPSQQLAMLLKSQAASSRPVAHARPAGYVPARTPITEVRTVLPVLAHRTGPRGVRWILVKLPGRPNGRTAWIRKASTVPTSTSWHLVVDVSARTTTVYHRGRMVRIFSAIVGKPSTPTPRGRFFVEEVVALRGGDAGAPFALALSSRSDVYQSFAGGPGQIALHGLSNVGGRLGTAVSHGCVRLGNDAMRWLVTRIAPGTPVTVVR